MSADKVAAIRLQNNNITASRVFLDDSQDNNADADIPNPVETFEQCFADYPDLMGKLFTEFSYFHFNLSTIF